MKTIILVIFFGILTYAFAETTEDDASTEGNADDDETASNVVSLVYGQGDCQIDNVDGLINIEPKKFFTGTWYLTHATKSTHMKASTICRDIATEMKDDNTGEVKYGYNENGETDSRYDVSCSGTQNNTRPDIFNFNCISTKKGESTSFHIDASVLVTDYDKFGVMYRCITKGTDTEDNVLILFRDKENPDEELVEQIKKHYGLNDLVDRKDATCETKSD